MYKTIQTASIIGAQCLSIEVEVDISGSWPGFQIIGLPDASVREAKERLRTAWQHAGYRFPSAARVTINLTPAHVKKQGSGFDLAMAAAMLCALHNIKSDLSDALFFGEIALNGKTRQTPGILALALHAKEHGYRRLFLPAQNLREASLLKGITLYPVHTLTELKNHLEGTILIQADRLQQSYQAATSAVDMQDIIGQQHAKRAMEIVAAGCHNIILTGVPGAGKTMLARALPGILPPLKESQLLEVNNVYSIAGLLDKKQPVIMHPPFRSPHHTASRTAIVGGGSLPKPGELSLAHHGVLFLDELPEFARATLESLRQPLQDGEVHISRTSASVRLPSRCIVVASQNPCPCGFAGSQQSCTCRPHQIDAYQKKVSGPLLDRFDLHVAIDRVDAAAVQQKTYGEASETVRSRVIQARNMQYERNGITNAHLGSKQIRSLQTAADAAALLTKAHDALNLSARGYHQILKVGRTIADLAGQQVISSSHIAEALQFRSHAI